MKMIIIAGLLVANSALHAQTLTLDAQQRAAFGIETVLVQLATEALSKPYPAKVQVPNAQLRVLSAPLEGVVEALLVAEGETVEQGQTLARVRSQGLLELQAAYLESHTRRALAGETLARDKKLYTEGIVARRRLLESQSAFRELSTAEERDRQSLLLASMSESTLKDLVRDKTLSAVLEVKSPLSGVVLEQIATAGQRLAVSDPLYRVGQLSPLWIEVHVPLNALGTIAPGSLREGLTLRSLRWDEWYMVPIRVCLSGPRCVKALSVCARGSLSRHRSVRVQAMVLLWCLRRLSCAWTARTRCLYSGPMVSSCWLCRSCRASVR